MKIAIIGSGISGLVAAYHLHRDHSISLFESNDYVGGHTNTVDVQLDGVEHAIDTGFIVFNDWTYPNFIELMNELDVESQVSEMSFSVSDVVTGIEYNGHSFNTLFAQRFNLLRPRFHCMLSDILKFNRHAKVLSDGPDGLQTVNEYLEVNRFSSEFRRMYLLPMGAAIWSCPPGEFGQFPIRFVADFYNNHGLLNIKDRPTWRVIRGGSRAYVAKLIRGFRKQIRLNTRVSRVERKPDAVDLHFGRNECESFDHVVFACHADQSLAILGRNATPIEREVLSSFPYTRNVAVLHTDTTVLPRNRRAWASWNYRLAEDPAAPAVVTYNMNRLQSIHSKHTFCVTLNGEDLIEPARVLGRFVYEHPKFTVQRAAAQHRHGELINHRRSSFCGAYWRNGFHEDGVVSALAVMRQLKAARHSEPERCSLPAEAAR